MFEGEIEGNENGKNHCETRKDYVEENDDFLTLFIAFQLVVEFNIHFLSDFKCFYIISIFFLKISY